jgi:hypothetical protein
MSRSFNISSLVWNHAAAIPTKRRVDSQCRRFMVDRQKLKIKQGLGILGNGTREVEDGIPSRRGVGKS